MSIFRHIKKHLYFEQILKLDTYMSWISGVLLYSICRAPSHSLNERQKNCKSSLNTEYKSNYYCEDGLRKVYPFYYNFSTICKERWVNRNIVDAFSDEYALYPKEEFVNQILKGFLKVNNKAVNVNYILKNGDLLSSTTHRHELAVLACPIKILFENKDLIVVDKPPSIPVHSCGLYHNNTILSILANEYNRHDLYIVYRLDRLTSGVLLFAKSRKKAREIHGKMDMRNINKEYICRVEGNFPEGNTICNKSIGQFNQRIGASLIHPEGKVAVTEFKKLSYNGKSSVVLCKPYTGRTHQIRVHLQYLGHPIINDPIYNSFSFGPLKGKSGIIGKSVSQLLDDLRKEHFSEWSIKKIHAVKKISNEDDFLKFSIFKELYHMNENLSIYRKDCSRKLKDKNCYFCKTVTQDPVQTSLGMFLHACKYETNSWNFESDVPLWALEDWNIA